VAAVAVVAAVAICHLIFAWACKAATQKKVGEHNLAELTKQQASLNSHLALATVTAFDRFDRSIRGDRESFGKSFRESSWTHRLDAVARLGS